MRIKKVLTISFTAFETVEEEKFVHPDWFLEVPEELDVCVAQRHFEEALVLLQKAKEYISQHKDNQSDHVLIDMERKVRIVFMFVSLFLQINTVSSGST